MALTDLVSGALSGAGSFLKNAFGIADSEESGAVTTPPPATPEPIPTSEPTPVVQQYINPNKGVSGSIDLNQSQQLQALRMAMSQTGDNISNVDFYPSAGQDIHVGNVGAGGYSLPVYAGGAAQLFPMAAYQKMRKQKDQEHLYKNLINETHRAKLIYESPDVTNQTTAAAILPKYVAEMNALNHTFETKYGSNWVEKAVGDPEYQGFISKWKGITGRLNSAYNAAKEYQKTILEKPEFRSQRNTTADLMSKEIINGTSKMLSDNDIDPGEMDVIAKTFIPYEGFNKFLSDNDEMIRKSMTDIPLEDAVSSKMSATGGNGNADPEYQRYVKQVGLNGAPMDYHTWVVETERKGLTDERKASLVNQYLEPLNEYQLRDFALPDEKNLDEGKLRQAVAGRLFNDLSTAYPTESKYQTISHQNPRVKGGGGGYGGANNQAGYYNEMGAKIGDIHKAGLGIGKIEGDSKKAIPGVQAQIYEAFTGAVKGDVEADDVYAGVHSIDWSSLPPSSTKTQPKALGEYWSPEPDMTDPKNPTYKGISLSNGANANTVPKNANVESVIVGYGIKKGDKYYPLTNEQIAANGMPSNATPVIIEKTALDFQPDGTATNPNPTSVRFNGMRVYPATANNLNNLNNKAFPKRSNENPIGNQMEEE